MQPLPRAEVEDPAARRRTPLQPGGGGGDQDLRFRPGDEDPAIDAELAAEELAEPDEVGDRLVRRARARTSAAKRCLASRVTGSSGRTSRSSLEAPSANASRISASRRGDSMPPAPSSRAAAPSSFRRPRRAGGAGVTIRPRARAA